MAIVERGEGNAKRKERLAQINKGPGTFVFLGGFDTEFQPTILKTGKNVPVLDEQGLPVVDQVGRQVFKPAGTPVYDDAGKPVLGGPPKVVKHELKQMTVRGVTFVKGKPTKVTDKTLALKLRCMQSFEEVDEKSGSEKAEKAEPKK